MSVVLLVVDVQYDFLEGGALAVPDGNAVLPYIDGIINTYNYVIATQDWHPSHHKSFASNHVGKAVGDMVLVSGHQQMLWPDHCVQHTHGAALSEQLTCHAISHTIQKGTDVNIDSYSAFFDNQRVRATRLHALLQQLAITEVHVCGLALDYCVKFTVLDAVFLGYDTVCLVEGCRAVNLMPDDGNKAIEEMRECGARIQ